MDAADPLRRHSRPLTAAFVRYLRRYLRRHFDALRVLAARAPPAPRDGTILYANHPSWWDPIVLLVFAARQWPHLSVFAPIDAAALERYSILGRVGLFPVERGTLAGARRFVRATDRIVAAPATLLALTPQGRFADPRERPVRLARGLAHVLARDPSRRAVPVAVEYGFWSERLPEALLAFGQPLAARSAEPAAALNERLERALESLQDELAAASARRNDAEFETALAGRRGVGAFYDAFEGARALVAGRRFSRQHRGL